MKKLVKKFILGSKLIERCAIFVCVSKELFPEIFTKTNSNILRNFFGIPCGKNISQLNQDLFALLVNKFNKGYFVEIGANDGFTLSNTVYLEETFGWRGILVEANPKYMSSLEKRSNSVVVNKAVCKKRGKSKFIDAGLYGGLVESIDSSHGVQTAGKPIFEVEGDTLHNILKEACAPDSIQFISIDVEGAEVEIVRQMVSLPYRFKCGAVEHNNRTADFFLIKSLLEENHYAVHWEGQTAQDMFFIDLMS